MCVAGLAAADSGLVFHTDGRSEGVVDLQK